ncbi:MAG: response regulator [Dehalococcoidia bacterium]
MAIAPDRARRDTPRARVLVVDDDAGVRLVVHDVLADAGIAVSCAADGAAALTAVAQQEPDVILLDLNMPVMDGRQFYHALRRLGRDVPVIVLSAQDSRAGQRELGADDALPKPFDIDELVAHVLTLVERRPRDRPSSAA